MFDLSVKATLGPVRVVVSNGGHSTSQWAEMCLGRLLYIAETAPPQLREQCNAARPRMFYCIEYYIREALREQRADIVSKLAAAGMDSAAALVKEYR